jgi:hypothetical protein
MIYGDRLLAHVRIYGYMDIWIYVYMDIWIPSTNGYEVSRVMCSRSIRSTNPKQSVILLAIFKIFEQIGLVDGTLGSRIPREALTSQAVRYVYVTFVTHVAGGALRIYHTRHSVGRRCVTYMSHPSLIWQAVRYVYITPVTQLAWDALRIYHTRHSHSRRCVTYVSHPSLTWQAVRFMYVTTVTHPKCRE